MSESLALAIFVLAMVNRQALGNGSRCSISVRCYAFIFGYSRPKSRVTAKFVGRMVAAKAQVNRLLVPATNWIWINYATRSRNGWSSSLRLALNFGFRLRDWFLINPVGRSVAKIYQAGSGPVFSVELATGRSQVRAGAGVI